MADVVLFHHVLGLTDGVVALADDLRSHGHEVHTPDLFGGQTFGSIDEGASHVDAVGISNVIDRGVAAVSDLPSRLVYVGISLGVLPAQHLAQTRSGAAGAVLMEACVPPETFGDGWPAGVPLQVHGMDADPFFAGEGDLAAARDLVAQLGDDLAQLFTYAGDRHLFVDRSVPAHDPESHELVVERVVAFLDRIDAGQG